MADDEPHQETSGDNLKQILQPRPQRFVVDEFFPCTEIEDCILQLYPGLYTIHPCHTADILSQETKKGLFYRAKPRNGNHGDEA